MKKTLTPKSQIDISNSRSTKILIGIVFFILLFVIIFVGVFPTRYSLKEGDTATKTIYAPKRIVDNEMTESLRTQAESLTSPIYDFRSDVSETAQQNISKLFDIAADVAYSTINDEVIAAYNNICSMELSREDYEFLGSLTAKERNAMEDELNEAIQKIYRNDVGTEDVALIVENTEQYVSFSSTRLEIAKKIFSSVIVANKILNEEATNNAIQAARDSVSEIVYEPGQAIVQKGDVITAHQIYLLKESKILREGILTDWNLIFGIALLIVLLMFFYVFYIRSDHKTIYASNKSLLLIGIQFAFMLLIAQLLMSFSVYLVPVAYLLMTMTVLFSPRFALQTNIFFIALMALALELDVDMMLYYMFSGLTGVLFLRHAYKRSDIIKCSFAVAIVNMLCVCVLCVLRNNVGLAMFMQMGYALGSAVFSGFLTMGSLLIWEQYFDVLTPYKLTELCNPNEPLLQKLTLKAAGTYHHSLLVGNLAANAADRIGADSLLARVGAYYHDIGKLKDPIYFAENQTSVKNPHDRISPLKSAKILKEHVSYGVKLGEKSNLPAEIIEFIRSHHGTSTMQYFYNKALGTYSRVKAQDYCYEGPLPKTKEVALVMLADSVEAAVRSMDLSGREEIEEVVSSIIDRKIAAGQLDESAVTFADIKKIKEAFLSTLVSIYHNRVVYPSASEEKKMQKGKKEFLFDYETGDDFAVFEKDIIQTLTMALEKEKIKDSVQVSVVVVDEEKIQKLNKEYRNVDAVTDVLSFPMNEKGEDGIVLLGDIVLCEKRAREQAKEYGHSLRREVVYLCVHSLLHLLGYDHEQEADQKKMRKKEEEIMQKAGIARK